MRFHIITHTAQEVIQFEHALEVIASWLYLSPLQPRQPAHRQDPREMGVQGEERTYQTHHRPGHRAARLRDQRKQHRQQLHRLPCAGQHLNAHQATHPRPAGQKLGQVLQVRGDHPGRQERQAHLRLQQQSVHHPHQALRMLHAAGIRRQLERDSVQFGRLLREGIWQQIRGVPESATRIYFNDKVKTEDQIPAEYKLFMRVQSFKC